MGHLSARVTNLIYGVLAEVGMGLAMIAIGLTVCALLVWWLA